MTNDTTIAKKEQFFKKLPKSSKKLVSFLVISMPMTDTNEKIVRVPHIHYLSKFQMDQDQLKAFFNSGSEVNAINPNLAQKQNFKIWKINVKTQKIDNFALKIFKIVIVDF